MHAATNSWFHCENLEQIPSPALLFYPDRIQENLRRMVSMAGSPTRLRPHLKTHKCPEVLRMQLALGMDRFKCATIAEAEMAASTGALDILMAYPAVGPNVRRLVALIQEFPQTGFSVLADDAESIRDLARAAVAAHTRIEVLVDIDCGQHRTGVPPGAAAVALYELIASLPGLKAGGLHAYDGHLGQSDPGVRAAACEAGYAPVANLRQDLLAAGHAVPRMVVGGTPTFPIHARRGDVESSPGTCVLWDHGYATRLPDLPFLPAALLLTRVISRPGKGRLCLDLGHKAVAAENPPPRVFFPEVPDAREVAHSEEHLVIETAAASGTPVGGALFALPWHVCPTVALHQQAVVVRDGKAAGGWAITARDRVVTI